MTDGVVELSEPERWLLERASDLEFHRKPAGVTHAEAKRLGGLGLLAVRRQRKRGGGHIMRTEIRRTDKGRAFLGLEPLNRNGVS